MHQDDVIMAYSEWAAVAQPQQPVNDDQWWYSCLPLLVVIVFILLVNVLSSRCSE